MGSIPANPDALNVPSFRRWRFEMKLSPFFFTLTNLNPDTRGHNILLFADFKHCYPISGGTTSSCVLILKILNKNSFQIMAVGRQKRRRAASGAAASSDEEEAASQDATRNK